MTFWDWADKHNMSFFLLAIVALSTVGSIGVAWARGRRDGPKPQKRDLE